MTRRKVIPVLACALTAFVVFIFYTNIDSSGSWQGLPQPIGLGKHIGDGATLEGGAGTSQDPNYAQWNPKLNFQPGSFLPASHNYTSTMVIAKTKEENIDWIKKELPHQETAVYVVDDPQAPLHPPKNKGHEVMVYLSYIIDHYENLSDVSIFMHAHQKSWHNDELLGGDAKNYIERLNRARVWREGYVNMRCSWAPGCPAWQHPKTAEFNQFKQEEVLLEKSWSELFPLDEVPQVLAQPCCAQFAISRERIQTKPLAQYVWYREWLFSTTQPDWISGRIWEYIWQFVFTGQNVICPKEHICFCEQYGTCFGGEHEYNDFQTVKGKLGENEKDLREFEESEKSKLELTKIEGTDLESKLKKLREEGQKDIKDAKKEVLRFEEQNDKDIQDAMARGDEDKVRSLQKMRGEMVGQAMETLRVMEGNVETTLKNAKKQAEAQKKADEDKKENLKKEIERLRPVVEDRKKAAEERGKDPKLRAEEVGREWHEGDGF